MFSILTAFLLMGFVSTAKSQADAFTSQPRPNIVFIMADDLGFNDIGYHNPEIRSPFLDQLSAEGVRLENYYVQPVCTPTRSQLMSGRYQIHTGMQHKIIQPSQPNGLPLDSPTLADKLSEAGYSTHMVGKWHLGFFKKDYLPTRRGFKTFYGTYTGSCDHFTYRKCLGKFCASDLHNDTPEKFTTLQINKARSKTYSTHLFTKKAAEIVENHQEDKPLFLYLSYTAVHGPLQVPRKYKDMNQNFNPQSNESRRSSGRGRRKGTLQGRRRLRLFQRPRRRKVGMSSRSISRRHKLASMVTALDEGVSKVVQALKTQGMWNNTVLVFSTDNGGSRRLGSSNYPLKGEKGKLWEGGIRAVGFVASPLLRKTNYTNHELMHVSDWYPTLVGLAGGHLGGPKRLDGYNQWGSLSKGTSSDRRVLLHNIDPLSRVPGRRVFNHTFDTRIRAAVRVGDYKLLTGLRGSKQIALFNIKESPNERKNIASVNARKVGRMLDVLQEFQDTAVTPYFPRSERRRGPSYTRRWEPWM